MAESAEPSCPDCGGRGWIVGDDRAAARCACRARPPLEDLLRSAGVQARYAHCSRASWRGEWRWGELFAWEAVAERDPWCVLILGAERGVGKTHLATALFRALLERDPGCGANWLAVADAVRLTLDEMNRPERPIKARLFAAPLLLLDEMGGERATEYALSLVSEVLDYRHRRMYPTILTANVADPDALAAVYGGRLASRLWEGTLIEELSGADQRRAT